MTLPKGHLQKQKNNVIFVTFVTWENGKWENGKWETGKWETSKWENGKWENGKWETGKWETGKLLPTIKRDRIY